NLERRRRPDLWPLRRDALRPSYIGPSQRRAELSASTGEAQRLLPSSIPPNRPERQLVGARLQRMDECSPGASPPPTPLPTATSRGARVFGPARSSSPRDPGGTRASARLVRILLLLLLVQRATHPRAAAEPDARARPSPPPVLFLLG